MSILLSCTFRNTGSSLASHLNGRRSRISSFVLWNTRVPPVAPYHMLGFAPVSNNILPVAPAGIWYDLHIFGNRIARKFARQSERLKRVLAYTPDAVEDAENIAEADDGETVRVADVNQLKEVTYGGAGNDAYNWIEWIKKNFGEQAGNSDLLQGTSTNAPTATQAEMLQANTSVRLSDMQGRVYDFTADVVGDLVFVLHTDPLIHFRWSRKLLSMIHKRASQSGSRNSNGFPAGNNPESG